MSGWSSELHRGFDLRAFTAEENLVERCDAAPLFFANNELNVFIEVHMDDLNGNRDPHWSRSREISLQNLNIKWSRHGVRTPQA